MLMHEKNMCSRCMPVVNVFHQYNKDLIKSTNADIPHKFKGRKAFIEPQRSNQVIWCYQCMGFGHKLLLVVGLIQNVKIAVSPQIASKNVKTNCQGSHSESSSKRPLYL